MSKNKKTIQYVDLPYNFISLPEKYYYPYTKEKNGREYNILPKYSNRKGISGYIEYKLIPRTDLAVEVRKIERENRFFLSGSMMRGRVRTNLEILSNSYPQFVNYTPMLFRDITGNLKGSYREKLGIDEGIEKSIQVGFLRKDNNNNFFVVPAKKFSNNKFFISIKEHELMKKFSGNLPEKNKLFINKKWPNEVSDIFNKITEIQNEVNKKTEKIKKFREDNEKQISSLNRTISNIFTKKLKDLKEYIEKDFNNGEINKLDDFFDKYWIELEELRNSLCHELKKLLTEENSLNEFFELMSERWMLKARIDLLYYYLTKACKKSEYEPYQNLVFFHVNDDGGIKEIYSSSEKEELLKGYLYNSTNAESKRSHYLINAPEEDKDVFFKVPEDVIESYKQSYKKIHFAKTEKNAKVNNSNKRLASFYNIFDIENYEKLIQENPDGLIVFFQLEGNNIKYIGRTPYFKIPYNYTLKDIIGEREKNGVDYADALFGYVTERKDNSEQNRGEKDIYLSYKSRLRFSAIDFERNKSEQGKQLGFEGLLEPNEFLLLSPSATAYGMYLKQINESNLITYQDKKARLRGYKYYHIWDEVEKRKQVTEKISIRGVIKKDSISKLKGKIYFYNLKPQELGLLLISLDIKQLLNSKKYYSNFKEFSKNIKNSHELIGGAKSYGYGNVEVEIGGVYIEKKDNSFESLIVEPLKKEENISQYIDKYLDEVSVIQKNYVLCRLNEYVNSKQERVRDKCEDGDFTIQRPKRITWVNLSEELGRKKGYPKEWRLIDR